MPWQFQCNSNALRLASRGEIRRREGLKGGVGSSVIPASIINTLLGGGDSEEEQKFSAADYALAAALALTSTETSR